MKCSRWQPQAIPTHMEHPLRPGAVPRQISPTNLQLRSKQIGHVESLFPNLGAHWISQMGGKVCKRCKHGRCQQVPNLIRLLEAKLLVLEALLEPVSGHHHDLPKWETCRGHCRMCLVSTTGSDSYLSFEVASVTKELFEIFTLKRCLLAC